MSFKRMDVMIIIVIIYKNGFKDMGLLYLDREKAFHIVD